MRMSARSSSIDRMPSVSLHIVSGRLASSACAKGKHQGGKLCIKRTTTVDFVTHLWSDTIYREKRTENEPSLRHTYTRQQQTYIYTSHRFTRTREGRRKHRPTNTQQGPRSCLLCRADALRTTAGRLTCRNRRSNVILRRSSGVTILYLQDDFRVANDERKHHEVMQRRVSPVQVKVPDLYSQGVPAAGRGGAQANVV